MKLFELKLFKKEGDDFLTLALFNLEIHPRKQVMDGIFGVSFVQVRCSVISYGSRQLII